MNDTAELTSAYKSFICRKKARRNIRKSVIATLTALDQPLRSPPLNKPFFFKDANKTLSNYLKTITKRGDIAATTHKQVLTNEEN